VKRSKQAENMRRFREIAQRLMDTTPCPLIRTCVAAYDANGAVMSVDVDILPASTTERILELRGVFEGDPIPIFSLLTRGERDGKKIDWVTFLLPQDEVMLLWGPAGASCCGDDGACVVRCEITPDPDCPTSVVIDATKIAHAALSILHQSSHEKGNWCVIAFEPEIPGASVSPLSLLQFGG
jgi:hypothetical protein